MLFPIADTLTVTHLLECHNTQAAGQMTTVHCICAKFHDCVTDC